MKTFFKGLGTAILFALGVFLVVFMLLRESAKDARENPELTNDQIISETRKCMDAGLSAYEDRRGSNGDVIGIRCSPRNAGDMISDIKKSNITNVVVENQTKPMETKKDVVSSVYAETRPTGQYVETPAPTAEQLTYEQDRIICMKLQIANGGVARGASPSQIKQCIEVEMASIKEKISAGNGNEAMRSALSEAEKAGY